MHASTDVKCSCDLNYRTVLQTWLFLLAVERLFQPICPFVYLMVHVDVLLRGVD